MRYAYGLHRRRAEKTELALQEIWLSHGVQTAVYDGQALCGQLTTLAACIACHHRRDDIFREKTAQ